MRFVPSAMLAAGLLLAAATSRARAQHEGHAPSDTAMREMAMGDSAMPGMHGAWHLMAQAIPVVTHVTHGAGSTDLTEGYLAQAAAMARGSLIGGHLQLAGTFNAEGLTMKRGELSTGAIRTPTCTRSSRRGWAGCAPCRIRRAWGAASCPSAPTTR
jgi:hypothetical protein